MDARLGRIDAVIADVIAEEHVLEIKYYCAGHEPEAQACVFEIAQLQHIRTLLEADAVQRQRAGHDVSATDEKLTIDEQLAAAGLRRARARDLLARCQVTIVEERANIERLIDQKLEAKTAAT